MGKEPLNSKKIVKIWLMILLLSAFIFTLPFAGAMEESDAPAGPSSQKPWWVWPLALFFLTVVLGILAVLGGIGGGVLFVPIVSSFFPFHLDFVRGTGLVVALSGALAAGPGLLRKNLANIRLAFPAALIASTSAIFGALIGLSLPTSIVQISLGVVIICIAMIMLKAKNVEIPKVKKMDRLALALKLTGICHEESLGKDIKWRVHNTVWGFLCFVVVGFMAGMFGLGAGWANVPVLNMIMGIPLKIAAGTSKFLLSITDASAAWIYINKGAMIPLLVVPSVIGIMLGSILGVRIYSKTKPGIIRKFIIVLLVIVGLRALLKGFGI